MGRGGVGRLEGFVGRLILCFRPRFDRARTGDFLAEQKIRGFGSFKVLGVGDCLGGWLRFFAFARAFTEPEPVIFC
jgi:hypothetical protein